MFGSKNSIGSDFGGIYGRPWVVSDGVVGEVEAQALQGRSVPEPCQALDGRTAQPPANPDTEKLYSMRLAHFGGRHYQTRLSKLG